MYANYSRRMVFLAHPRTASRATRDLLIEQFGFHREAQHHQHLERHPGCGWTVFTTIRNHYDAWASWYYKSGNGARMSAALVAKMIEEKSRYWPDPDRLWSLHSGVADVILRYETLEADLSEVLGDPVELPRVGGQNRNGREYREIITPSAHAYIGTRYAEEIHEYGYGW